MSLGAVIVSTFGVGISYGIGYPLASLTFEQAGEPAWMAGLAGSAPALAIFLLLPFFPALVGRLGAVPSMAIGCMVVALGFALMWAVPNANAWIAIRFLMGAGLALPWLVGETWINTVTTDSTRARVLSLYAIALFCGFAVGPAILEAVGLTGPWPFVIGAAGVLLAVVPILLAARLAPALPTHPEMSIVGAALLVPVSMAGVFLGGFLEMSHFALLANYAVQNGLSDAIALRFLTLLMVGGVALQFAVGWIGDRVSRVHALIGLAVLFAVTEALLPALIRVGWAAQVLVVLIGGVMIGFYTLALALLGERVQPQNLAVANAAFLIMYQAGAVIGPTISGATMTLYPVNGFVVTMVFGAIVLAVAMFLLDRSAKLPATTPRAR